MGIGAGGTTRRDSIEHVFFRRAEVTAESIGDEIWTCRKDMFFENVELK
jgi:hypothetical protein